MDAVETILLLMVFVSVLALVAERLKVAYPIVLVLGGLVVAFIPGLPRISLDPEIVFELFLPPVLFAAAFFTSPAEFKANLRPILLLAFGLVAVSTIAVAYAAKMLLGLPLEVGFLLGAIISPSDAIAATAIAERLHLPRKVVTILEGESLINDAAGLLLFKVALGAIVTGHFSVPAAALDFVVTTVGGVMLGLVIALMLLEIHKRMADPGILTILTLLSPFATYLPAEALHVSGVLSTVAAGIYIGRGSSEAYAPQARIQAGFVWETLIFLVNGLAFALIGLQLPVVLEGIRGFSPGELAVAAITILAVVILIRILWVFPATYLPRMLSKRLARHDPSPPWEVTAVIGWTGMRGIVSLAAALSLPTLTAVGAPLPGRDLVLFLSFVVILGTLVIQGLTLPPLIKWFKVGGEHADDEETEARKFAFEAALLRLDEIEAEGKLQPEAVGIMRRRYKNFLRVLDSEDEEVGDERTFRELDRMMHQAERTILISMRDRGAISEGAFRRLEHDLDLRATR